MTESNDQEHQDDEPETAKVLALPGVKIEEVLEQEAKRSSEVIDFPGSTYLDVPVERVFRGAIDAGLESVIIIGRTSEGAHYFASSRGHSPGNLWLVEKFKQAILSEAEDATPPRRGSA